MQTERISYSHRIIIIIGLIVSTALFPMCEKERYSTYIPTQTTVKPPTFEKYLTWTDYDGFDIMLRFKNGGDERENMSCTVYWRQYGSKPINTPTKNEMNRVEDMRVYDHDKRSTVFEIAHVGFSGGTYIYYYTVCENSVGRCETPITFCIIKR